MTKSTAKRRLPRLPRGIQLTTSAGHTPWKPEATGRVNQRRRTRTAIVDAAIALLQAGETPSVAAVADAADVSRRTVYMYFPTLDQLLIDATAGALGQQALADGLAQPARADDAEGRVEALARSAQGVSPELERLGRALIRLTVEADGAGAGAGPGTSLRSYRRVEGIEQAVAPVRGQLDAPGFRRLVSALALVIGWEALIVERDVLGLASKEAEDLSAWAARALLRAALDDHAAADREGPQKPMRRSATSGR